MALLTDTHTRVRGLFAVSSSGCGDNNIAIFARFACLIYGLGHFARLEPKQQHTGPFRGAKVLTVVVTAKKTVVRSLVICKVLLLLL